MPGEDNEKYLQAAAECLELARAAKDDQRRAGLVAPAQMWLDLAYRRSDETSYLALLEAFNDWQTPNR